MIIWCGLLIYITILKVLIGKLNTKNKKIFFFIFCGIGISIVMGCRYPKYEHVSDLNTYYKYYKTLSGLSFEQSFEVFKFEPGYIILNKLLSCVIKWPQFIIIFEACFCVSCTLYFIYKNSNEYYYDSIIFYLTFGLMSFQLTGFRQAIAMSICLLGVEFIKKRKIFLFFLLVALASTFHKTALIFLVTYYFINKKINLKQKLIMFMLLFFILIYGNQIINLGNSLFNMKYTTYIDSQFGGVFLLIIYSMSFVLSILSVNTKDKRIGTNMTFLAMVTYIMRYFVSSVERISLYFFPGILLSLPNNYEAFNKKSKKIFRICMIFISITIFIYHIKNSDWGQYRFFWNK